MRWLVLAGLSIALVGCRHPFGSGSDQYPDPSNAYTRYASGFTVRDEGSHKLLRVLNPWQFSRDVSYTYVLSSRQELLPDSLMQLPWIKTPVKRVVVLSTTHVAMIEQLGQASSIVGLSGSEFIYSPEIRKYISSDKVADVGYGQGLDFESIVELNPDVLFIYGVEGNVVATLEKLTELGIPVVFCGGSLDAHPLG